MLVPTVTDEIDAAVLAQAGPNLKLIANFGNGVDNIDVQARARARHHRHQHARRPHRGHRRHDDGADPRRCRGAWSRARASSRRTSGRAGRRPGCSATASPASGSASSAWAASARRWRAAPRPSACRSTTTTAAACPQAIEEELEATYWESLDQMLARMDIVSVNCPHTPATYHLLSAPPPQADEARGDHRQHGARRDHRRDARSRACSKRATSPAPGSTCSSTSRRSIRGCSSSPGRQGRAPAAYGLGDPRGPRRHGREGDRQHQDLHGRPPPPGPRAAVML